MILEDRRTLALAVGVAVALRRSRGPVDHRERADAVDGGPAGEVRHPGGRPLRRPETRDDYASMVDGVRALVAGCVPPGSEVMVASRGDADLVQLDTAAGRHFPSDERGSWAGYHPALGAAAHMLIEQRGAASHLVVPATSAWWFDTYPEVVEYLAGGVCLADDPELASVWQLPEATGASALRVEHLGTPGYRASVGHLREIVSALVDPGDTVLVISRGDPALIDHDGVDARHFPSDVDGSYGGHPADDRSAVETLRSRCREGSRWLLIPCDADWWAEHYPGFWSTVHLDHRVVVRREAAGTLIHLEETT